MSHQIEIKSETLADKPLARMQCKSIKREQIVEPLAPAAAEHIEETEAGLVQTKKNNSREQQERKSCKLSLMLPEKEGRRE